MAYHAAWLIAPEARSGDGTVVNVGVKVSGHIHCQECNQQFDTDRALKCHVKYMHGNKVYRVIVLSQAGDEVVGSTLGGDQVLRFHLGCAQVGPVIEQVADSLKTHAHFIALLEGGDGTTRFNRGANEGLLRQLNTKNAAHPYIWTCAKSKARNRRRKAKRTELTLNTSTSP